MPTQDDDKLNEYYSRGDRVEYLTTQLQSAIERHEGQHEIAVETLVDWCTEVSGHANPERMEGDIRDALKQLQQRGYIEDYTEWQSGALTLGKRFRPAADPAAADDTTADGESTADLSRDRSSRETRAKHFEQHESRAEKLAHLKTQIKTALVQNSQTTYELEQVYQWGGRRAGLARPQESDLVEEAIDQLHKEGYINKHYGAKRVKVQGKLLGEKKDLLLDDTDLDDIKRTG